MACSSCGSPRGAATPPLPQRSAEPWRRRSAFGDGWHTRLRSPPALGEHSEPEADIAVVAGEPEDYIVAHPSTAALVVEVADASLRLDRRFKAAARRGPACASIGS